MRRTLLLSWSITTSVPAGLATTAARAPGAAFVLNNLNLLYKLCCDSCQVRHCGEGRTWSGDCGLAGRPSHEGRRYGLKGNMILGLVGSILGSLLFRALGISPESGIVVFVIVAFVGAAVVIVAQRKLWEGHASRDLSDTLSGVDAVRLRLNGRDSPWLRTGKRSLSP
jgi:uncharacterized membrane protein YeaQ/YmgE (transglycosylase-associated protein family)